MKSTANDSLIKEYDSISGLYGSLIPFLESQTISYDNPLRLLFTDSTELLIQRIINYKQKEDTVLANVVDRSNYITPSVYEVDLNFVKDIVDFTGEPIWRISGY